MACQDDMDSLAAACLEASARQPEYLHVSRGRPGTRAPHMLLERNGKCLCTCDLFGEHFVLLAGADGTAWCDAALQVANRLGIRLVARRIGAGGDLVDIGRKRVLMTPYRGRADLREARISVGSTCHE